MLIQGISSENRLNILKEKYTDLILSGVKPEEILVLFLNSYKKTNFIKEILKKNPEIDLTDNNIYTFYGLCYNAFKDNREYISSLTGNNSGKTAPNLCGLDVSQYIFKQSIKTADFSDYISKINLLHQLFRRYSLIVQNCLTVKEVEQRSLLLNEVFYKDAQKALEEYKRRTFEFNSFDYLRQMAVFPFIYKNTDYFKDIKYLFIDDGDEYSYAFWNFIDYLMPRLKDYYIAYDKSGCSRCGYLSAYKSGISGFIKKYNPKITDLTVNAKFSRLADTIYNSLRNGEKLNSDCLPYNLYPKRIDMINGITEEISSLLKSGIKPYDIAVITPNTDDVLINSLHFANKNYLFQVISGSEKLNSSFIVKHILIILKLFNNLTVSDFEIKSLFTEFLKIPYRKCMGIILAYIKDKVLKEVDFNEKEYDYSYKKLLSLIKAERLSKNGLTSQIKIIYTNMPENMSGIEKEKYDFLLKEAESFETAFNGHIKNIAEEFIIQTQNSVISENPVYSFGLDKNSIIVSTPQKIIDYSIETKYQFWLDINSIEWMKNDTGTLYNAWVLNRDWEKDTFTIEDNIKLTRDKTARILRKLALCAKEQIYLSASIYDNTGNENFGGIADFIEFSDNRQGNFKIIPRDDQKPVLEYKSGKLGIMAVPGAGKTTILLALIIKLINDGINPENIFVLTYMESAAKNFKDKIQLAFSKNGKLPNISTIHGLALRIIKENGNYIKAGLDDNFDICDDIIKEKFIKELFFKLKIDDENYENYLKCISIAKLSGNLSHISPKYKDIQEFFNFFKVYNTVLKQNNLIDYDDMLYYAVKILEENQEIREYYQNICEYVIEDEAQDSTDIQQRLIGLINGKHNNLIRCGDINQAITSTFTNSNPESFKSYIQTNKKVEMVSSQRCSKPIFSLANSLIKASLCTDELSNAFYNIEIKGTKDNPKSDKQPEYLLFNDEREEKQYILKEVSQIQKNNPSASIAILLRLNSQVNEYNEIFMSNGIKTDIKTDCLNQKPIYRLIISLLNVLTAPNNNKNIYKLAEEYKLNDIYNFNNEALEYIRSLKEPFITKNTDEITDEGLLQLYWDIDYWLNNSSNTADFLVLSIGLYYAKNSITKSNCYMIAEITKRLAQNNNDDSLEEIIKKLEYTAQKPLSAYNFFDDKTCELSNKPVAIMTMHKAKGDEFDYVFIPELNEENYPVSIKNVKLKNGTHFIQTIKNIVENCGIKSQEDLKKEFINETLRLLFVGITRAKTALYLTNAKNYKKRKNTKTVDLLNEIINSYK